MARDQAGMESGSRDFNGETDRNIKSNPVCNYIDILLK